MGYIKPRYRVADNHIEAVVAVGHGDAQDAVSWIYGQRRLTDTGGWWWGSAPTAAVAVVASRKAKKSR
ncbi:hypothetical protein FACS189487_08760 [Campylobacterota bacterium]|nr:hypothetical protein FACS189487_08760 [Campylobacterota bacterium]